MSIRRVEADLYGKKLLQGRSGTVARRTAVSNKVCTQARVSRRKRIFVGLRRTLISSAARAGFDTCSLLPWSAAEVGVDDPPGVVLTFEHRGKDALVFDVAVLIARCQGVPASAIAPLTRTWAFSWRKARSSKASSSGFRW